MTIRWERSALAELADAWLESNSDDRPKIVAAAAEIDRQLLVDPETLGESRPENARLMFIPPLGVPMMAAQRSSSTMNTTDTRSKESLWPL